MRDLTFERGIAYWRTVLDGAPARVELPADGPVAAARRAWTVRSMRLPPEFADKLSALGGRLPAAEATALFAAFNILLYRLSGHTDLVVGISNRSRAPRTRDAHDDVLPIRTLIDPQTTFADAIARMHDALTAALAHAGGGSAIHSPNVVFRVCTDPHARCAGDGDAVDLALHYASTPRGLTCALHFVPERFAPATIERWLDCLARLTRRLIDEPQAAIGELDIVANSERERYLVDWNPEPGELPELALHECFERRAAAQPTAVALDDGEREWTYGDLNMRANALAGALRAHGVERSDIVAVGCARVPNAILAMLAVVKAGAAYLPLDAACPPERMRLMFDDCGARLAITDADASPRVAGALDPQRTLDLDALDLNAYGADDPAPSAGACELAYVMYTSGTTGRPKGAQITQRGVTNLVLANPAIAISRTDVVAQIANIAFDAATFEIWGALLNGARLAIADRETILVPAAMARWLRAANVSVAFFTSALLRHISREVPDAFGTLRCLIAGGDVVDPDAVRAILAHGRPHRFLNGYGPTETTTFATTHEIACGEPGAIPIGRPLANVQAYVLDERANLVPIGVQGQLHIGGAGLARGYVNDPELTARKFVRHPFSSDPAARLYATGDIARQRPDGTIEFLGRRDRQLKLRGYRIELDEIAAALRALPDVADAVVTVREAEPGEKRLVAYVVERRQPQRDAAQWRAALSRRLPEYMLPSSVVNVPAIPLNANGKLDTARLAATADRPELAGALAAQSPLETDLATALAELLGVARVGRDENFFSLGGHSLLAMRVIARIGERFGVRLTLREFFAGPTVAELAARIAATPLRACEAPAAPRAARSSAPVPLSPAQQRLWLIDQIEPGGAAYNVPYAYRVRGPLDIPALERALAALVRRHDVLHATFTTIDGVAAYVTGASAERFALAYSASAAPGELDALLARERDAPFDLAADLPIRARLVCRAPDEHVLIVAIHHIATDGWSMGIFKRELGLLYAAECSGAASPLAELRTTYAEFARRQNARRLAPEHALHLRYWRARLAAAPPPLIFAPRPSAAAQASTPGRLRSRRLASETQRELEQVCRARGITEFTLFCAAFAELLYRRTGQRDLLIGTALANRSSSDLEALIGFFVDTLPIRIRREAEPSAAEWLDCVNAAILETFDHADVPFQELVEIARPARSATQPPLVNVMVVLQNVPDPPLALAGLEVVPVALERTTAKFDLTLEITTGPDGARTIAFEYRTDLFDAATIDEWLATLETIIRGILDEPSRKLSQLAAASPFAPPAAHLLPAVPRGRAVPAPAATSLAEEEARAALRSIWQHVLGVEAIGVDDNFFDLGGHSLLAVRLMAEVAVTFGPGRPLSLLFAAPTIAELARALVATPSEAAQPSMLTYNAAGRRQPLFFFHGSLDGGGVYCRTLAEQLGPDQPLHVIGPRGMDGAPIPPTIEAMAVEHAADIRRVAPHGPYLLGGYCAGGLVAYATARILRADGADITRVVLLDVPDASVALAAVADGIDAAGVRCGVAPRDRLRLTSTLARLPHHAARLHRSASKSVFVRQRLAGWVPGRRRLRGAAAPATAGPVGLVEWTRRTEAYVPRRFDAPVTMLLTSPETRTDGGSGRGWSQLAPRIDFVPIAGTHATCITAFADDTARAIRAALPVHIDERATASTAESTRPTSSA